MQSFRVWAWRVLIDAFTLGLSCYPGAFTKRDTFSGPHGEKRYCQEKRYARKYCHCQKDRHASQYCLCRKKGHAPRYCFRAFQIQALPSNRWPDITPNSSAHHPLGLLPSLHSPTATELAARQDAAFVFVRNVRWAAAASVLSVIRKYVSA